MMEIEDDTQSVVENLKSSIFSAQKEIKLNAYNYDGYVKLISLLSQLYSLYKSQLLKAQDHEKKTAEDQTLVAFNKLRNARQSMATLYPLSIELWLQWIEDELNAPTAFINYEIIDEVFSKATVDYLSVDIWCQYAKYLISRLESGRVTISSIEEMFEKAVINCGLHYKEGNKIWESYQQFEQNLLFQAEKKLKENNTPENINNFKTCLLNLIKIFKRQMHVPLSKVDELLTRFTDIVVPFNEALKQYTSEPQLYRFEEVKNILAATSNKIETESIAAQENYLEECQHSFEAYQSYINQELDADRSDPARIQCLFERAIVHHCLKPSVWLDYIDFLNDILKQSDLALVTCKRALRNVTWDSRIYVKYALILEQNLSELDEIRNIYEMGLEKYSDNGFNYVSVWISYVSFEKRICHNEVSLVKKKPQIYELIQKAIQQLEGLADPDKFIVEFMIFWVNIEKFWFNDESKSEVILKYFGIKFRNNYSLWYQIVTFARAMGFKHLVNELFNIGLAEFPDSYEQFGQSWINAENIVGSLGSCNRLEKKINIHISFRMQSRKMKESLSIKSKTEHQNKFLIAWLNRAEKQLFSTEESNNVTSDRSSFSEKFIKPSSNKNRPSHKVKANGEEEGEIDVEKGKYTLKRKHEAVPTQSENSASVIGPVMPPGFLQPNNDDKDDIDDDTSDMEDILLIPGPKKLKFTEKTTQSQKIQESDNDESDRTVYVSNLHPSASESDLKIIFGRAGEVQKVDLHRQRGGKIFAFITFSDPEEAQNAFELEHTPLRNRPVYVSKFNRNKDKNASHATPHYSQQEERNKLFVSNLDKSTTPNDLEKLFNHHGNMTSLRLINKKGSSKPFAYVEFKTEKDASRSRNEVNNSLVRGRKIIVEFSDPGRAHHNDRQKQLGIGMSLYHNPKVEEKKTDNTGKDKDSTKTNEPPNSSDDNKPSKKVTPTPFGLIPLQARNPRNQQPTARKPKVRISVTPASSSTSNDLLDQPKDSLTSDDGNKETTAESSTKSNDDFRKMLLSEK